MNQFLENEWIKVRVEEKEPYLARIITPPYKGHENTIVMNLHGKQICSFSGHIFKLSPLDKFKLVFLRLFSQKVS